MAVSSRLIPRLLDIVEINLSGLEGSKRTSYAGAFGDRPHQSFALELIEWDQGERQSAR